MRREARPFYAALFVLQTFGLVARRFYIALMERLGSESVSFWQALSTAIDEGKLLDIAAVSLSQLERDGAKAIISTVVLMEVWDIMMATRDTVNDWLEKRREKARAEGIAERAESRDARNSPPKSRPGTSEDWPPKRTANPLTNRLLARTPDRAKHGHGRCPRQPR